MCANDRPPDSYQPLLNRLFDSEAGSDVVFLVGSEAEGSWRFPGHRSVLCAANPVFKAMLENFPQATAGEQVIAVRDVDGRAFDLLLRYLYKEDVSLQSVSTALSTLYAAQKYLCPGLVRECLVYLDSAISSVNALQVYEHLRVHSGHAPSAPPLEVLLANTRPEDDFTLSLKLLDSLLFNTLLFIDLNGEEILSCESVEDLTVESLKELLLRDTLDVRETLVYSTLERWSNRECKRCHLELSQENRRAVLGEDILFSVRYLLMSEEEFCLGPRLGGLLSKAESMTLLGYIQGAPVTNTCSTLSEEGLVRMRRRRRRPKHAKLSLGKERKPRKTAEKKNKKKKKKEKGNSSPSCSGSCVADYVLRALACIFD